MEIKSLKELPYKKVEDGIILKINVQPGSSKNEFVKIHEDVLKVRLTAPPEGGKANAMLIKFLSEEFNLRKSDIEIIKGAGSRNKVILIKNIDVII